MSSQKVFFFAVDFLTLVVICSQEKRRGIPSPPSIHPISLHFPGLPLFLNSSAASGCSSRCCRHKRSLIKSARNFYISADSNTLRLGRWGKSGGKAESGRMPLRLLPKKQVGERSKKMQVDAVSAEANQEIIINVRIIH